MIAAACAALTRHGRASLILAALLGPVGVMVWAVTRHLGDPLVALLVVLTILLPVISGANGLFGRATK